jgi:hypothetical protein
MREYEGASSRVLRLIEEAPMEPGDDRGGEATDPGGGVRLSRDRLGVRRRMGWSRMLAQVADVWVVTRANNRDAIEEAPRRARADHLRFVYVDLSEQLPSGRRAIVEHGFTT